MVGRMVDRDALDFLKTRIGGDIGLQRALGWPKDNKGQVVANWRRRGGVPLHSRGAVHALLVKHEARTDMVAAFERITQRAMGRAHGPTRSSDGKGNGHGGKGDKARKVERQRRKPERKAASGSRART
jgi:hypothetical protein